jgi:hypothetical protein
MALFRPRARLCKQLSRLIGKIYLLLLRLATTCNPQHTLDRLSQPLLLPSPQEGGNGLTDARTAGVGCKLVFKSKVKY